MIFDGSALGFDKHGHPFSYNASHDGSGNAPTLLLGPQGTRKTVLIIDELLDEPGARSYIVFDPKGEICATTSAYRRRVSDVKIINPYGLLVDERPDMASDGWNPLGDLDPADDVLFGDECQAKAEAVIRPNPNDVNSYFAEAAASAATLGIMWEVRDARAAGLPPSLPNVRAILSLPPDQLQPLIQRMIDFGDFDISSRAAKFLADNREINGIKNTVEKDTGWMMRPMRDDMATTTGVDFRHCTRRVMTVYVIIPADALRSKANYIRLLLSSALRGLYKSRDVPATLIIEEAFILGYHAEIEQALSVLRGFGSRMTIAFQSYQQIRKLYPETHGLFTAGTMVAFRPADLETGEMLVKKVGKITAPSLGTSEPKPGEPGPQAGWTQRERDRIPLAQMMAMPKNRALVWRPGDPAPRMSWVKGYFDEIPELGARASPNPYYRQTATRSSQAALPSGRWRSEFDAGRQRVRAALERR